MSFPEKEALPFGLAGNGVIFHKYRIFTACEQSSVTLATYFLLSLM